MTGHTEKADYLVFYQRKQGNGWRENEQFEANTIFTDFNINLTERWFLCFEYTHMDYLAQQPGGLTDYMFEQNPRQSVRERNWFQINWNIPAIVLEYQLNANTKFNLKTYSLIGSRKALGNLQSVTVADQPDMNRNLLWDDYQNFGSELRVLHRYQLANKPQALAFGLRYFEGNTQKRQGEGNNSDEPTFEFLHPEQLEDSDFTFPSRNIAFFAENIFNISSQWSITPGLRAEYINTQSEGYYRQMLQDLAGNVIFDTTIYEQRARARSFLLAGVGVSYKPSDDIEVYGNISQNYRAINFNDLRVNNPNLKVDEQLEDEKGFNADLGIRGTVKQLLTFDWSLFYLRYNNRIGAIWMKEIDPFFGERAFRYRTNVSDAYTLGIESYTEFKAGSLIFGEESPSELSVFLNGAMIQGRYIASQESAFRDKKVELVPPVNLKAGITYGYKNFSGSLQYTFVEEQFSEATNTKSVASGVDGIIPAYDVVDLSIRYNYKFAQIETGINNLTDNMYFTRRATGYPGPGIIPSPGRNFYITLDIKI
ncbi:outer membrane receptor for Fe3+-dicitrate [Catalinimonas alkaloidigena]|uniref:TonB-dependent receptor family protein n=1 Tax=Catalinimonas alkaloidigena TaxID=1075417 RepID=UPI0024054FF1|nr:TonB-dependent receptor [Catalinimonas alkaloidigena]MDF9797786.1 outer membrane receptor for Fe3+-dicitrate [Catalinimonas alkaloidigena]